MTSENNRAGSENRFNGTSTGEAADFYKALGNETRLKTFQGLDQGMYPSQIASELDVSRQAVQNHLNYLVDKRLLEKEDREEYRFTAAGTYFLKRLDEDLEFIQDRG